MLQGNLKTYKWHGRSSQEVHFWECQVQSCICTPQHHLSWQSWWPATNFPERSLRVYYFQVSFHPCTCKGRQKLLYLLHTVILLQGDSLSGSSHNWTAFVTHWKSKYSQYTFHTKAHLFFCRKFHPSLPWHERFTFTRMSGSRWIILVQKHHQNIFNCSHPPSWKPQGAMFPIAVFCIKLMDDNTDLTHHHHIHFQVCFPHWHTEGPTGSHDSIRLSYFTLSMVTLHFLHSDTSNNLVFLSLPYPHCPGMSVSLQASEFLPAISNPSHKTFFNSSNCTNSIPTQVIFVHSHPHLP